MDDPTTGGPAARPDTARTPKGMHDVLWPESDRWQRLIDRFALLVEGAGYGLAITPILEHVGIFDRGIGKGSEIVGKEMYTFADRDGQVMALRPEGTASIVRAFVQHHPVPPWKAWYWAPSFRHENPQQGRYRQHFQLGLEAIGPSDADLDVEVISLAFAFIASLGLHQVTLKVNSMGDGTCRPGYVELLRQYLAEHEDELSDAHRTTFKENPLRVLDCKDPGCQSASESAPRFLDNLCEPCMAHFTRLRAGLDALDVPYQIDHRLVRGFDYYTRTTFEFASGAIEAAQNALGGGGRYNGLVEMLGGPPTPGIGFGLGVERLLIACDAEGVYPIDPTPLHAYVVDVTGGESAVLLTWELRRAGMRADRAFDGRSMKSQMKSADRSGALVALLVGPKELAEGTVVLRPLRQDDEQRSVARADIVAEVRRATAESIANS
ncbi:MAG TPA: histidine--tRNA ligase [Acidimicrobiales bacterium]|nr:histidine--tRNA ligase [Acidimicrobiales bacterium]